MDDLAWLREREQYQLANRLQAEENAVLQRRLAEAEDIISSIVEIYQVILITQDKTKNYDLANVRLRAQTFLSHAPSDMAVTLREYAILKVRKASLPPGASLVLAYEHDGNVVIDEDQCPEWVAVRRDILDRIKEHQETKDVPGAQAFNNGLALATHVVKAALEPKP